MNPKYFGDSYDIVKRFFCKELASLGYAISVNPMFTGDWEGNEAEFYRFVGACPNPVPACLAAIFFDPDTGVHDRSSMAHVSLAQLSASAGDYDLAFSFDQSFSRQYAALDVMQRKLFSLAELGTFGMYYESHARFLFASSQQEPINELRRHLLALGLPSSRLVLGA